jgi:energy-coupling factor transport system permease protein
MLTVSGFALGARRGGRTRYRPDPWRAPEWLVALTGVIAALTTIIGAPAALNPSTLPLVAPTLPLVPCLGVLVAILPAWIAPPLPRRSTAPVRRAPSVVRRERVGVAS